ncbi:MAG: ABC transporter substrate-binding protein [Proteobacteria bacterium]|nr:ABC transporter substrate-binding protein [Pseudomonadota bacterium]
MKKGVIRYFLFASVFFFVSTGCLKKDEGKIKVVVIGPFEHVPGIGIKTGARLAAEEINQAGGITVKTAERSGKRRIELEYVDDRFADTAYASVELRKAIDEKGGEFIVGGYASKVVLPLMEVMAGTKTLWLGTGGSSPKVVEKVKSDHEKYKYYFRTGTISSDMAARSIAGFSRSLLFPKGLKRAATVCVNHSFAKYFIKEAQKHLKAAGTAIVLEEVVPLTIKDFSRVLEKISESRADFVVVSFLAGEAERFIEQVSAAGLLEKTPIVGSFAPANDPGFFKRTGGRAVWLTHAVLFSPVVGRSETNTTQAFFESYRRAYGKLPHWTASATYDSIYLLKNAIERAGSLDTEKIIALLESDDYEYVGFRRLKWYRENHDFYRGEHNGKSYVMLLWEQFFPDGRAYYVYPEAYSQREFHVSGK